jgi:hypothetical protein
MKRQDWIFLGVIAIILGLLYFSNMREGFVSVNPLPTQADIDSAKLDSTYTNFAGTLTPTMQKIHDYIQNLPWATPQGDSMIARMTASCLMTIFPLSLSQVTDAINGYSTKPTFAKVVTDFNNLRPPNNKFPDSQVQFIITNGKTQFNELEINLPAGLAYALYKYVFGDEPSSSPASTPIPAPSTTVNIPSPCHPGTRSIPGGYLETRCFNS